MTTFTKLLLAAGLSFATTGVALAAGAEVTHVPGAQAQDIAPMEVPGVNAWLQDALSAEATDKPLTCGFFRIAKSDEPLIYDYDYDETKIVLDGVITVDDGTKKVDAQKGDVLLLPKGAHITFTTETEGTAWVCGARPRDTA
ncbi:cupin domain-containing protein [Paracoccus sulfuroxidans]|uniref:Ethanolamine utilization protein EutQ n=1 Tax=Paracoccus sulfuroxidans TaxID=384678 RepID=A0A562NH45_9RHOB|nr:cupin domain-containing protein [Paracoccus sulfuroxidans]TWI31512.1 ethanolamine utilization protein EutQ [Paracoccus sulfuroxidans]